MPRHHDFSTPIPVSMSCLGPVRGPVNVSIQKAFVAVLLGLSAFLFPLGCRDGSPVPNEFDAGLDSGPIIDAEPLVVNCRAKQPSEDAVMPVGATPNGGWILPGGRLVQPWGVTVPLFGLPLNVLPLEGNWALVTGTGHRSHMLWLLDTDRAQVTDSQDHRNLFYGLDVTHDGTRIYAGGGEDGSVYVYDLDLDNGSLLPQQTIETRLWVGDVKILPDGRNLAVLDNDGRSMDTFDITTNLQTGHVMVGAKPYALLPDASRDQAYVSLWWDNEIALVDLGSLDVVRTIEVGKNPQNMVMSQDGKRLYVACTDEDEIQVIDLDSEEVVARGPVGLTGQEPRGLSPSHMAIEPGGRRLFVTSAGLNAVLVYDAADLSFIGAVPAAYYPTGVSITPAGDRLYIVNGKGFGTGPGDSGAVEDYMWGNLQILDMPTDEELAQGAREVHDNYVRPVTVEPQLECDGEPRVFPVPVEPGGPTPIRHVILIVRENKTYDAILGDLDTGDGDPDLSLFTEWETPNLHALARRFTSLDNFHANSDVSIQGHQWLTAGLANDFIERLTPDGESHRSAADFYTVSAGWPKGGYVWAHLREAGVDFVNWGEAVGVISDGQEGWDQEFPSPYFDMSTPDVVKAEYVVSKVRDEGYLPSFVYLSLPNDHTYGTKPGKPTPQSMVADNDEATGMVVDAVSHSPFWASTVIFVVEDDPQQGADHVDMHRSICLVISPWAKRGHTSHVNSDFSSLWATITWILGVMPLSVHDANAAPMYDAFSKTQDSEPYDKISRNVPEQVNAPDAPGAEESMHMDFSEPDQARGLDLVLWRAIKGTNPPQAQAPNVDIEELMERPANPGDENRDMEEETERDDD